MDGAGRLARSLRSLGPQADLKAAAIGAAVLLRERLGRRARVPAKRVIDRARPNCLVHLVERYLPNRTGIALTVVMLLGSTGLGIVKGGHVDDFMVALSDTRNALANSAGFRITTVAINGRKQLSQDEVLAVGGVSGRSSLLFLDAATVRNRLKANPWIADATILKLIPAGCRSTSSSARRSRCGSRTAGCPSSRKTARCWSPTCRAVSWRCRWWWGRAPTSGPVISSRRWTVIRRSAS